MWNNLPDSYLDYFQTKKTLKFAAGFILIVVTILVCKVYITTNIFTGTIGHNDENVNIALDYDDVSLRSFDPTLFQNLSEDEIAVEKATDPLPFSTYCEREVFLLILVISQPGSFKRRNNIRDSWAFSYQDDYLKLKNRKPFPNEKKFLPKNVVKTVFILGKSTEMHQKSKLHEESRLSKDLVFGDFIESYRNLTLKTKLALKWTAYNCKSTFVIKTDDDVFINPVVLVEWLKGMPQWNLYTGSCNFNAPVIRDKNEKWYISYNDYKGKTLSPYCVGGGYLMSEDLLLKVVRKSYGRKVFPMEDFYVGLIVKELGVKPRDEKKYFNVGFEGKIANDCMLNSLFLAHRILGDKLFQLIIKARFALENC